MAEGTTIYTPDREGKDKEQFSAATVRRRKIIAVQGVAGIDGSQGPQGASGTQGSSSGIQGIQGTTGIQGSQGSYGLQGATGSGSQGTTGSQGSTGIQGHIGSQGIQGTTGSGTQGVQGILGTQGTDGSPGGAQGTQGIQGYQGTLGVQGSGGIQGQTGTSIQGTAGSQGIQGILGAQGRTGTQGVQGTSGIDNELTLANGSDNRVVTATGVSAMNAEANLTFNGSQLGITGTVLATSTMTATNFILSSDKRIKKNIIPFHPEKMSVEYKQFEMESEPGIQRYGVIAQELIEKHPELVRKNSIGFYSVSYMDLFVREIVYLKSKIDELESAIKSIKNKI